MPKRNRPTKRRSSKERLTERIMELQKRQEKITKKEQLKTQIANAKNELKRLGK